MQKWETHLHTYKGSSCAKVKVKKIAKLYAENGYSGIVCTNHFNMANFESYYHGKKSLWIPKYLEEFYALKKACQKYGITVLLGLEMSLLSQQKERGKKGYTELLLYGITPEELLSYGVSLTKYTPEELFRFCNQRNWLLIQSHPFRTGVVLHDLTCLHGLEVYNGHPRHKNHNELALACAQEHRLLQTAGSDFHEIDWAKSGMLFADDVPIHTEQDFVLAVRSGKFDIKRRN